MFALGGVQGSPPQTPQAPPSASLLPRACKAPAVPLCPAPVSARRRSGVATDDPRRAPRSARAPVQHCAALPPADTLSPLLPLLRTGDSPLQLAALLDPPPPHRSPSPSAERLLTSPGRGSSSSSSSSGPVFPALESPLAQTQPSPRHCPSASGSPLLGTRGASPPALALTLGLSPGSEPYLPSPPSPLSPLLPPVVLPPHPAPPFVLEVVQQPPARTVYQKILRPFPAVRVLMPSLSVQQQQQQQQQQHHVAVEDEGEEDGRSSAPSAAREGAGTAPRLIVEVALVRESDGTDVSACLEGARAVPVADAVATFRKLKVLCTSQQQGSNLCLRFALLLGTDAGCRPCAACAAVTSAAIEVYSHTVYLSPEGTHHAQQQQDALRGAHAGLRRPRPPPAAVTEVVPRAARPGEPVVVVGTGFAPSPALRVLFGATPVCPEYNDAATLLCTVPAAATPGRLAVRVALDGVGPTNTFAEFTVLPSSFSSTSSPPSTTTVVQS